MKTKKSLLKRLERRRTLAAIASLVFLIILTLVSVSARDLRTFFIALCGIGGAFSVLSVAHIEDQERKLKTVKS